MELSELNGRRIAVLLCTDEQRRVFKGTARYACDGCMGNALRIELDHVGGDDGNPAFVIHGSQWCGELLPDTEHGCDFQLDLCAPR